MFKSKPKDKYILAIESSCDDTSIAIYNKNHYDMVTISSACDQSYYGGVVPELAARKHEDHLLTALNQLFKKNQLDFNHIDFIAYTAEPGLKVCLNMGKMFAKTLAYIHHKPLKEINHIYSHLFSFALDQAPTYPFIGLVISGGHTTIYHVKAVDQIELLNATLDDAVGEVYDKVGRKLEIAYPCGPIIDKAYKQELATINFLTKKIKPEEQFSFSGIKSQVLNYIQRNKDVDKDVILSSFQKTMIDIVVDKINYYAKALKINTIAIGGGVAANNLLRTSLQQENYNLLLPQKFICGDNALMIGLYAYLLANK